MTWEQTNSKFFEDAERDPDAVEGLLQSYLPRLRAYVHMRLPRELRRIEGTEDVAQSVCRDLLGEIGRFEVRGEPEFRSWLFTTALNKIREKHRFHSRQKRDAKRNLEIDATLADCLNTASTPSLHAIALEEAARLREAIDGLPDEYRDVVLNAYVVGMSRREIGELIGRSEGAVRMLLGRALAKLGKMLQAE